MLLKGFKNHSSGEKSKYLGSDAKPDQNILKVGSGSVTDPWCVKKPQILEEPLLLNFLVHKYSFKLIFPPKNFPEESWLKNII
jgi:hypothetical protein